MNSHGKITHNLYLRYITILYQESYGFERIQDLIKTVDPKKPSKLRYQTKLLFTKS